MISRTNEEDIKMRRKKYISEKEAYEMFLELVKEELAIPHEDSWQRIFNIYHYGLLNGELDRRIKEKGYDILHRYE